MMTDPEAKEETERLMADIVNSCIAYANKDGLQVSYVLRTVGNGLIMLADRADHA